MDVICEKNQLIHFFFIFYHKRLDRNIILLCSGEVVVQTIVSSQHVDYFSTLQNVVCLYNVKQIFHGTEFGEPWPT